MSDSPTITLHLDKPRVVTFDFDTLVSIEAATGMTLNRVAEEITSYAPVKADGEATPTIAAKQAAANKISVTFVGKFMAGCLRVDAVEFNRIASMRRIMQTFVELLPVFTQALTQMGDDQGEDPTGKTQAPSGASSNSAPGPA